MGSLIKLFITTSQFCGARDRAVKAIGRTSHLPICLHAFLRLALRRRIDHVSVRQDALAYHALDLQQLEGAPDHVRLRQTLCRGQPPRDNPRQAVRRLRVILEVASDLLRNQLHLLLSILIGHTGSMPPHGWGTSKLQRQLACHHELERDSLITREVGKIESDWVGSSATTRRAENWT